MASTLVVTSNLSSKVVPFQTIEAQAKTSVLKSGKVELTFVDGTSKNYTIKNGKLYTKKNAKLYLVQKTKHFFDSHGNRYLIKKGLVKKLTLIKTTEKGLVYSSKSFTGSFFNDHSSAVDTTIINAKNGFILSAHLMG